MASDLGYPRRWETEGEKWHRILAYVDQAFGRFLSSAPSVLEMAPPQLLPLRWDLPDRTLVFLSPTHPGVWNAIHVLVQGSNSYALRVSASAWADRVEDDVVTREWAHSSADQEGTWAVDVPSEVAQQPSPDQGAVSEEFVGHVFASLLGVYGQLQEWRFDQERREWVGAQVPEPPTKLSIWPYRS
jgi:hypothetical protein